MSMLFKRIKDWAASITSFRTGDVIPVDGPSGTAKMPYSDLAKEVIKDSANNTAATEADLVAGSKLPIMTANGPKALPGNAIAKASEQTALTTYAENVAHSIAPEYNNTTGAVAGRLYMHEGSLYRCEENISGDWDSSKFTQLPMSDALAAVFDFTDSNDLNGVIKELYFPHLSKAQVESIDTVIVFKGYSSLWGITFKAGSSVVSSMTVATAFDTGIVASSLSDGGVALIDLSVVQDASHDFFVCKLSQKTRDIQFSPTISAIVRSSSWSDIDVAKYSIYSNSTTNPSSLNNLNENGIYLVQRTSATTTTDFPSDFPSDGKRYILDVVKAWVNATVYHVVQTLREVDGNDKWFRVYVSITNAWTAWKHFDINKVLNHAMVTSDYQLYSDYVTNPADLNDLTENMLMIIQRTSGTVTQHFPSDFPTDGKRVILEVIKSKFKSYVSTSLQILTSVTTTDRWWRLYNFSNQTWTDWFKSAKDGTMEFHVGTGQIYTTLRSAIAAANLIPNSLVVIHDGTYDLLSEFADSLTDAFDGNVVGIELKNGVHVFAMDGVKITANVPDDGTYTDLQLSKLGEFFNPFYSKMSNSFILENIDLEATNTRYCVHDDHSGNGTYVHKFINCKMKFANTISRAGISKYVGCIGGGLGVHATIVINGGYYEAHTVNGAAWIGGGDPNNHQNCISYHNGNSSSADSFIQITGVFLADRGYIRFSYYGPSTIRSLCEVSGCSFGLPLVIGKEKNTSASDNVNFDVITFCNEQKVEGVHWEVGDDGHTQTLVSD